MRARVVIALSLIGLATVASTARSDVGLISIDRTSGRPGDRVVARFGGYDRQWPRMPVYLVPARRSPQRAPCLGIDPRAVCEARVPRAPKGVPYTFLGRIHYAPPARGRFRFRVPRIAPGLYALLVYCAPCYKGPGGSVIDTGRRFRILRAR
ncbi:MAG TPA: hypothetical protein VF101_06165 [Gaiellaceae bacterium]